MSETTAPLVIVLMGVAGCGKSTTGAALAKALGWPFRDADSFHPPANIEKMSRGCPSTTRIGRRGWRRSRAGSTSGASRASPASSRAPP